MIRMTTLILSVFLLIFSSIALADSRGGRGGHGGHSNNQHGNSHGNRHYAKNYGYGGHGSGYRRHGYARHGRGHGGHGYRRYLQPHGYYGPSSVRLGYYSPGLDIVYQSRPYGPGYNGYVH